jgi:hypothetical protein
MHVARAWPAYAPKPACGPHVLARV